MSFRGENISIGFSKEKAPLLSNISFQQKQGDLVALFGRNGTGKTSFIRCITGITIPDSGAVYFNENNLTALSRDQRAQLISVVLTDRIAPMQMQVREMISSGRLPYMNALGKYNPEDEKIIDAAIEKTGIESLVSKQLYQLSDGEKQKVFIARALIQDTPVMILDEPTSFLDIPAKNQVIRLLRELSEKYNKLVVFSSHDYLLSVKHATHIWLMDGNKNLLSGTVNELKNQTETVLEVNV